MKLKHFPLFLLLLCVWRNQPCITAFIQTEPEHPSSYLYLQTEELLLLHTIGKEKTMWPIINMSKL